MALYVNTNVSSLNAQRKLTNATNNLNVSYQRLSSGLRINSSKDDAAATNNLNVSYQRLSSGLRINSSKDDAAGLQISDRLTSQINGLNQGNRNANDGIALAQTIEGALDETTNMLQRIRTLAVQAATGTNTEKDRQALQEEVTSLCEEITRIANKTTFAGQPILNGTKSVTDGGLLRVLTGANAGRLGNDKAQLFFQVGANAYDELSLVLQGFAMSQIAVEITLQANQTKYDQMISSEGGTAILSTSFNSKGVVSAAAVAAFEDNGLIVDDANTGFRWSVCTAENAQATLNNIDKFIQYVDSNRAALGAIQNRMESTIRNQSSISENESDARSRIRDTDFASETAALTQNNIIQQASQTVLAQANQRPTIALNLLGQ